MSRPVSNPSVAFDFVPNARFWLMFSLSAAAVNETYQSSDSVAAGVGVATKLVVGTGGDPPPPPPLPPLVVYVGVGNGAGFRVALGMGVGRDSGSGEIDMGGKLKAGVGKFVGAELGVSVTTGGVGDGDIWDGFDEQPTVTNMVIVTNNKAAKAFKILQTFVALSVAT